MHIHGWRLTMNKQTLDAITNFWKSFSHGTLYETGWNDIISYSNATKAGTREDLLISCAFLSGAVQTVILTQPHMSRSWQLASKISIFTEYVIVILKEVNSDVEVDPEVLEKIIGRTEKALLKILDTEIDSTIA